MRVQLGNIILSTSNDSKIFIAYIEYETIVSFDLFWLRILIHLNTFRVLMSFTALEKHAQTSIFDF